ncbi:MAG: heavy-metal-associated domain-containing protein [Chlorobi bacterium]|nr:heavy-metal-associated domain-containing protein [Chlorobiota bacterium]
MQRIIIKSSEEKIASPAFDSTLTATIVIHTGGITCTGCENIIKGGIQTLPGIAKVSASYNDSMITVTFDSVQTSVSAIDPVIMAKGYQVLTPF